MDYNDEYNVAGVGFGPSPVEKNRAKFAQEFAADPYAAANRMIRIRYNGSPLAADEDFIRSETVAYQQQYSQNNMQKVSYRLLPKAVKEEMGGYLKQDANGDIDFASADKLMFSVMHSYRHDPKLQMEAMRELGAPVGLAPMLASQYASGQSSDIAKMYLLATFGNDKAVKDRIKADNDIKDESGYWKHLGKVKDELKAAGYDAIERTMLASGLDKVHVDSEMGNLAAAYSLLTKDQKKTFIESLKNNIEKIQATEGFSWGFGKQFIGGPDPREGGFGVVPALKSFAGVGAGLADATSYRRRVVDIVSQPGNPYNEHFQALSYYPVFMDFARAQFGRKPVETVKSELLSMADKSQKSLEKGQDAVQGLYGLGFSSVVREGDVFHFMVRNKPKAVHVNDVENFLKTQERNQDEHLSNNYQIVSSDGMNVSLVLQDGDSKKPAKTVKASEILKFTEPQLKRKREIYAGEGDRSDDFFNDDKPRITDAFPFRWARSVGDYLGESLPGWGSLSTDDKIRMRKAARIIGTIFEGAKE